MSTRIEGIIDRLTDAESFDDIKWIVGDGIVRNYAQSIVDDHIKANAEFQGKAGLEVTVERVSVGKTCKWCLARCGKFTYPNVPDGTWDRHVDCDCYIIYNNGRVKQTLKGTDKKWNVVSEEQLSERKKVGLAKPTEKVLEARKIVGLEDDNKLRNGIGAEHYDSMQKLVDASDNETAKKAWEKAAPKVEVGNAHYNGLAHASTNSIYVDIDKSANGSYCFAKYSVAFHESGHAIDFMAAKLGEAQNWNSFSWYFSSTYKNGLFRDTIKKEVDMRVKEKAALVKDLFKKEDWETLANIGAMDRELYNYYKLSGKWRYGNKPEYSKGRAYSAISKDIRDMGAIRGGDISDIYEGATNGRAHGQMGHGASYWKKDKDMLPTEAFAEFTSATFSNPESLEAIKEWFPESYKVYLDMLEVIAENGV